MDDLRIRNFQYKDVDDFIRIARIAFAEEWVAEGITPEDFEQETRKIFRWKMIPYKLLTALMGIQWEGFVAEKDGKVVGGGMYIGRKNRMSISNLMVDPAYRRQGIGQALLERRLERLKERGFPFVTAQVLETNTASLQNLRKQGFKLYNQYSVYECSLPISGNQNAGRSSLLLREIAPKDRALFREIEQRTTPSMVLRFNGSAESQYFLSFWQKMYNRFAGYTKWIRAVEVSGETIGFLSVSFQAQQQKGFIIQPVVREECLDLLPEMLRLVGAWLEQSGRKAMIVEILERKPEIHGDLYTGSWNKQYTWLELAQLLGRSPNHK